MKDSGVFTAYIFRILAIHACRAIVETSHVLRSSLSPKRVSCHFKHTVIQLKHGVPTATATGTERVHTRDHQISVLTLEATAFL